MTSQEAHAAQTWMVTGASRGLGRAVALAAVEAGHVVVATVRGPHDLPAHDRLHVRTLDVRDRARALALVADVEASIGGVDVLVSNAGYGLIGTAEEVSEDDARAIVETNLLGALWVTQAVLPGMRSRGSGHVVHVSTVGAVGSMPALGLYNASKWGLEGFVEALAAEVADLGIRVTIAELGGLDTQWATASMRFAEPLPAYDGLRERLFGTAEVPWPAEGTGGGTSPQDAADALLAHVADPDDRLRVLVGDDAPAQVAEALRVRLVDYDRDARFTPPTTP